MIKSVLTFVAILFSLMACTANDDCYVPVQKAAGAGGDNIGGPGGHDGAGGDQIPPPAGAGGDNNELPRKPLGEQVLRLPAEACDEASQSPCMKACIDRLKSNIDYCATIQNDGERENCASSANTAYRPCATSCQGQPQADPQHHCAVPASDACVAQCNSIGASCVHHAYHPYSPSSGIGDLYWCKGGWPTWTCSYKYANGDNCTWIYPMGTPLCLYQGGKP
jgi:hypothetical protein